MATSMLRNRRVLCNTTNPGYTKPLHPPVRTIRYAAVRATSLHHYPHRLKGHTPGGPPTTSGAFPALHGFWPPLLATGPADCAILTCRWVTSGAGGEGAEGSLAPEVAREELPPIESVHRLLGRSCGRCPALRAWTRRHLSSLQERFLPSWKRG